MRRFTLAAALAVVATLAVGCPGREARPEVRLIHASPGAPPVDVYVMGESTPLFAGLPYGEVSAMEEVQPGEYVLEVRAAGAPASSAPLFTSAPLSLEPEEQYTLVATGVVGSSDSADLFRLLPLRADFDPPQMNQARLRIIHAGVDAPAVDLDVGDDGSVELTGLGRFAETGPMGVLLPANQPLRLALRAGQAKVTSFTLAPLSSGAELYAIVSGRAGADPSEQGLSLIVAGRTGRLALVLQDPVVYALHAAPDAPAVDLFVGEKELVDNLSFSQLSGRAQLPPGAATLDLFAYQPGAVRPPAGPVVSAMTPELMAGRSYLVAASGFLTPGAGEPGLRLVPFEAGFAADEESARVRGIHLSPDTPPVDFGVISGVIFTPIPELTSLVFPSASPAAGAALTPGVTRIGLAPAGTTAPVAQFEVMTRAGLRLFAIAAGTLNPTLTRPGLQLIQVDASAPTWTATTTPSATLRVPLQP